MSCISDREDESGSKTNRNFKTVIECYESQLSGFKEEVKFYKKECEDLRNEVKMVIEENKKLSGMAPHEAPVKEVQVLNESNPYHEKKMHEHSINNLKAQIRILLEEKETLENLWKTSERTVTNYELEIIEYKRQLAHPNSIQEVKKEYEKVLRNMELNMSQIKKELEKQLAINKNILETKNLMEQRMVCIEKKYQEILSEQASALSRIQQLEKDLGKASARVTEITDERSKLEKSLANANVMLKEHIARETEAVSKVQEALLIAETAISEKEEAQSKEKEIREECDHLTKTIGEVMEEAAEKVDREMQTMKKQYTSKIECLHRVNGDLKDALDKQTNKANTLVQRVQQLEMDLNTSLSNNKSLDEELHLASLAIIELELKLEAFEKLMTREHNSNMIREERTMELKEFLQNHKKLKDKWRSTVNEVTGKLQKEIQTLQDQNESLAAENNHLKHKIKKFDISSS